MIPKLRPYQQQALEAESRHRAECPDETRLAIVLATGLGKGTIIAERAVRHLEEWRTKHPLPQAVRVLILAHTDEIVTDLAARCALRAGRRWSVGIVKAERDEAIGDIVVASVQTLANPSRRQRIQDVGLVIVDECHHSVASSYEAILRHFGCFDWEYPEHLDGGCSSPPTPALGFTATLERGDGASLGHIWQDVVFTRDISWGVRHGYLVQPVGHRLEIALEGRARLGKAPGFASDTGIMDSQLIDALAPEKIVEKWLDLAAGLCEECRAAVAALDAPAMPSYCPNECLGNARPTIAFMPLVRSAQALADAFAAAGVSAVVIHGGTPSTERRQILEDFWSGRYDVLCNAMVLTEGFDSARRPIKSVIIGRPTKSRPLFVQMAGRGLRPELGVPAEEQDCVLITVADATTDLCTVADLSDRPLDRKMQGALTAMEDAWDLGAALEDPEHFWTGQVDAREFDPLARRSSKVWRTTKRGTPFLPISKDGEYVFVVGTSVFVHEDAGPPFGRGRFRTARLHKDLPDLELAMQAAEDEAVDRGGDLGRLLADRNRPWRKLVPSDEMKARAFQLGLRTEVEKILAARAGGKAGKVSDLISQVIATQALEPVVERIKEATK